MLEGRDPPRRVPAPGSGGKPATSRYAARKGPAARLPGVAQRIADAASARGPRARYLLPVSSRALVGLMTRLPELAPPDRAKSLAAR